MMAIFHNDFYYTIMRHHWQVSENHMPRVHPSHVREIGKMETIGGITVRQAKRRLELDIPSRGVL